jgi:predicted phage terminase large subunit-like protein
MTTLQTATQKPPDDLVTAAQAALARIDFRVFCEFVHQVKLAPHMLMWHELYESTLAEDREISIAAPPDTWKSRVMRMRIEWSIGRRPDWSRILCMNAADQVYRQILSVQETIARNPRWKMVFPEVRPARLKPWTRNTLYVTRPNPGRADPTLVGVSVDGAIQGVHAEELYTDDLTDQKDVRSPTIMRSQAEFIRGTLSDRLIREGGRPVGAWYNIMTRWGENDHWTLFVNSPTDEKAPGMGFHPVLMPAVKEEGEAYPWGRLLWPEHMSDDYLEQQRLRKGSGLYRLTFLCDPSAMGGMMWDRRKFNRFNQEAGVRDVQLKIHSWDPAVGDTDNTSRSAFCEVSVTPGGYYLTHAWAGQPRYHELLQLILRMREDRHPNVVLIETRGIGTALIRDLQAAYMTELRLVDPMGRRYGTELRGGQKIDRAARHTGLLESGRLWVPRDAPWAEEWLQEIGGFPSGKYTDQMDAFSQALEYARFAGVTRPKKPLSWMDFETVKPQRVG